MKIQDFDKKYYFHDSLVDSIIYNSEKHELVITFDFCYWAQADYKKNKPETGLLRVTFKGVKKYDGVQGTNKRKWWAVLDGDVKDDKYHLFIQDIEKDIKNEEYHDIYIEAEDVEVEDLR